MKRFSLSVVICVVMVCVVCSSAMGAFKAQRRNAEEFAVLCQIGTFQDVRDALNAGSDWDERALRRASGYNTDPRVISLLINDAKKSGTDVVNMRLGREGTALHMAVAYNDPGVVKVLIEAGANVNAGNDSGQTPLDVAKWSIRSNRPQVIEMLKAAGAK